MINQPFFSIIIPLFNKEKSINKTIGSVLSQHYVNFEIVIVNDGSTDTSLDVVKSISDTRIKVISQTNTGVSAARNKGITSAIYEYIIPLDADDLFLPGALEEFAFLINNFPMAEVFVTAGYTSKNFKKGKLKRYYIKDYYLTAAKTLAKNGSEVMMTGVVAVKKDVFDKIGMYDTDLTHGEDINLWQRIINNYIIAKSDVNTFVYNLNSENRASHISPEFQKFRLDKEEYNNFFYFGLYKGITLLFALRLALKHKDYHNVVYRNLCYLIFLPFAIILVLLIRLLKNEK
jgi:glycosyltransferase involved in cell wall biosynthesis